MSFKKYARAVSDEKERKLLHGLYVSRIILPILYLLFVIAAFVTLVFSRPLAEGDPTPIEVGLAIASIVFSFLSQGCLIAFIAVAISFSVIFKRICKRPLGEGESPEVYDYRTKYAEYRRQNLKDTGWALAVFIISIVVSVVLVAVYESINTPIYLFLAMILFIAGFFVYYFTVYFRTVRLTSTGKNFEALVSDDIAVIDAEQGRAHKYSVREDKNAQRLDYVYPFPDLLTRATALKKRTLNRSLVVSVISVIVFAVIYIIDVFQYDFANAGYLFPALILFLYVAVIVSVLSLFKENKALDKETRERLVENENYSLNLKIFDIYAKYSKHSLIIMSFTYILSSIVGFVIAYFSPNNLFSLLSMVAVVIGLIINQRSVIALRQKAIPLEKQIDEKAKNICAENLEEALTDSSDTENNEEAFADVNDAENKDEVLTDVNDAESKEEVLTDTNDTENKDEARADSDEAESEKEIPTDLNQTE